MLSAIAKKVMTYNKAKSALLSYEDVVGKLLRITRDCVAIRDPGDPIIEYYKVFIQHYFNNIGDPLTSSQLHLHSKEFEAEVIHHFAAIYKLGEDNIGGYIDWDFPRSELFIIHLTLTRFREPPIYFLRSGANRRISSLLSVFGVKADRIKWIDSDLSDGGMDLNKLRNELQDLNDSQPIVVWLSLGDVNGTIDNLHEVTKAFNDKRNVHIHYSCSNLGIMMPYLDNDFGINFENGLDSICFPLGDFFGVPLSGGIALTKKTLSNMCCIEVDVVKEKDSTIPGSRMGHLQLLLWVSLKARGDQGIREEIDRVQKNCKYLRKALGAQRKDVKTDRFGSCIFLEAHSTSFIEKWNLQKVLISKNSYKFEILPHFCKSKLNLFVEELLGASPRVKIDYEASELPKVYPLSESNRLRLDKYSSFLTDFKRTFVGYPINIEFSDKHLKDILKLFEFNVTKKSVQNLETDLFSYMSGILRIPKCDLYAVITSGGSFSNLLGFLIPRAYMDDPIIYVSHDAHYSVLKFAKILRLNYSIIKSQESGEIDYEDLEETIKANHPRPVIISLNIGSTMKGAIDSIKKTKLIFQKLKLTQFHIHCDAALDGGYLPLVNTSPQTGFDLGIDSLAISLHKYLGVPIPCSIFLTRKNLLTPENLNIIDDIFSVKDGILTALIWYAINRQRTIPPGMEAKQQLEKANFLLEKLQDISYPAWKNNYSNIVYFKKPSEDVITKWKLATVGELSHIVLMQHIDHDIIMEFLADMKSNTVVHS